MKSSRTGNNQQHKQQFVVKLQKNQQQQHENETYCDYDAAADDDESSVSVHMIRQLDLQPVAAVDCVVTIEKTRNTTTNILNAYYRKFKSLPILLASLIALVFVVVAVYNRNYFINLFDSSRVNVVVNDDGSTDFFDDHTSNFHPAAAVSDYSEQNGVISSADYDNNDTLIWENDEQQQMVADDFFSSNSNDHHDSNGTNKTIIAAANATLPVLNCDCLLDLDSSSSSSSDSPSANNSSSKKLTRLLVGRVTIAKPNKWHSLAYLQQSRQNRYRATHTASSSSSSVTLSTYENDISVVVKTLVVIILMNLT